MHTYFERHQNVALMLSGGKDSTAALIACRPYWPQITVYWSNPGAALPETIEQMRKVAQLVPNFREVRSDVLADIEANGWPVDVVPHAMTPTGRMTAGTTGPIVRDRINCCYNNLMYPAYNRAVEDGCTLIVRGERQEETNHNRSVHSGFVDERGVEHLLPVYSWTTAQVMQYLRDNAPDLIHPAYAEGASGNPDCYCCTAFWDENYTPYLRTHHPRAAENRIHIINLTCATALDTIERLRP